MISQPRIATQPNNVNQHAQHDNSPSFIDSMNRSLINWGVPRPTFNGIIIEPIYSVITLLALLLFGLPGLLVIAFIYAARQFSRPDSAIGQMIGNFLGLRSNNNAPTISANNNSPAGPSRRTFGGAGNRLGDN